MADEVAEILSIAAEFSHNGLTVFVSARVAREYADLLESLTRAGHEVAFLDTAGGEVFMASPTEFAAALSRDAEALRHACGQPVIGYRGAAPSLATATPRWFDALERAGFRYDSSVMASEPRTHETPYDTVAVPGATFAVFPVWRQKLPGGAAARIIGSTYLQALPMPIIVRMLRRGAANGYTPTLYLRPGDLEARIDPVNLREILGLGHLARWKLGLRQHPKAVEAASAAWKLREILRIYPPRGRLCDALPSSPK